MIKQHYPWWGYVRSLVREWHEREDYESMQRAAKHDYICVNLAVIETERMTDGESRLKLIRMMHWDKTHTLGGAALDIPCGRSTAARWQREFFEAVARNRGLMD